MFGLSKKFKFFKKYDIFGCPVALTMKNEDTYKTIFGGIVTSILTLFFLGVILYSFFKLFTRQNMETNKYELNLGSSYGFLDLNQENFMLAVKFDAEILNNWTLPFMNLTLMHVTQFRNTSKVWKNKTKVELKPCTASDFVGLEADFPQLGLKSALCPSPGFNLTVQGNYQEDIFAYFQIILTTCSQNMFCQSNETIYKEISKIDKLKIQFFIINNVVDERNYEKPISRQVVSDMHFLIDPIKSVYRTADIFLNEIEITTDEGYTPTLLSNILPNKTYSYNQEFREQTVFTTLDGSQKVNIADFYFRKSQKKYQYDRFLGNLLAILSYLGGIWSTCYVGCMFFFTSYSRTSFANSLSNKLYNYPSQKKRRGNRKKTLQMTQEKQIEAHSPISPSSPSKGLYSQMIQKIEKYLSYEQKLKFSFTEMWKYLFKKIFFFVNFKDEKFILMNKSEKNMSRDLDVCNILRKLHEFDKIKSLLFSQDQLLVLGFSPKPEIIGSQVDPSIIEMTCSGLRNLSKSIRAINRNKNRMLEDELTFDDIQPFKRLIYAWKNLKKMKENPVNVNDNLIRMFGEEFSRTIDLTEEELQMFFEQGKAAGNKFFGLINALKVPNKFSEAATLDKPPDFNPKNMSRSASENFIECEEGKSELALGEGNKIEKQSQRKQTPDKNFKKQITSKLNNIKGKLGLNFLIPKEESAKITQVDGMKFNETGENTGRTYLDSGREMLTNKTSMLESQTDNFQSQRKKKITFHSININHDEDNEKKLDYFFKK